MVNLDSRHRMWRQLKHSGPRAMILEQGDHRPKQQNHRVFKHQPGISTPKWITCQPASEASTLYNLSVEK